MWVLPHIFNTRNYYPLMNKRNVATFCNAIFEATVVRYVLLKNVLFCACTTLDLLRFFNCIRIPKPYLFFCFFQMRTETLISTRALFLEKFPSHTHVS